MKKLRRTPEILTRSAGFTLAELIIVIVLLGIVGVVGADFISQSFKGFIATDTRTEIYEEGTAVLMRMERELRNTIPNAVNVEPGGAAIKFGLIDETAMTCPGGTDPEDCVFGQYTDKKTAGKKSIKDRTHYLPVGSIVSIYNRNWTDFSATDPNARRLYKVVDVTASSNKMKFFRSIIAASPNNRFYAVDKAVRYSLDSQTLQRAVFEITGSNYLSPISFPTGIPLAEGITSLVFDFQPGTLTSNAMVSIRFTITKNNETVRFHTEVQIRNAP